MRRATFLISALCLLIIANVLMMSFASPVFTATGEGFVSHMAKKEGFRNYSGSPAGEVELGPDSLFMFKNNQCKPECCGASFSCDGGCVCTTPKQRKFINERGGNRTVGGDV